MIHFESAIVLNLYSTIRKVRDKHTVIRFEPGIDLNLLYSSDKKVSSQKKSDLF